MLKMCKTLLLLISAIIIGGISSAVFAADYSDNIYIGAQIGRANLNYSGSSYELANNRVSDKPWSGRAYLGYSFNELFSAELGYFYSQVEFKHLPTGNKQSMKQHGLDLAAKVTMALNPTFNVYAKAGGAVVYRSSVDSCGGFFATADRSSKVVPLGGVGLGVNFTPALSADLAITGTMKNGSLPNAYFYGVGLKYKFQSKESEPTTVPTIPVNP